VANLNCLISVAVEAIPKGSEVFVSYNFGPEAGAEWLRRQYEAVVAQGLGHLYVPMDERQCTS
jgi:hypothetical protein